MSLKKIVGGNTLYIQYNIRKNSNTEFDNLTVFLLDVFKKKQKIDYEISENDDSTEVIINIKYEGSNQKTFGKFSVVVFNNYNEENQQCLVYKDAFILVHALKNRVSCFGDDILDSSGVKIEIDSDLSVDFNDQRIRDFDTIMKSISDIQDSIDNIQDNIDFSTINSSINYIKNDIENTEETIVRYLAIIDNSVNLQKTDILNVSTRINDLSTYIGNLNPGSESYDDSAIQNRIADVSHYSINVSTRLDDLSTYTHNITIPNEYDDSALKQRIADVSQYVINVNSSISDLSTRIYTIEQSGGSGEVDLTEVNSSISDLSTRIYTIENEQCSPFREYALYSRVNNQEIPESAINTSNFLFHDIIVNVSNNSIIKDSYVHLLDTKNNREFLLLKGLKNYYSYAIEPQNASSWILKSPENEYYSFPGLLAEDIGFIFRQNKYIYAQGHFYAYHFPYLMKVTAIDTSVMNSVKQQLWFRIED